MIIKYTDFINESLECKDYVVIRISQLSEFLRIKDDLERWGIVYDKLNGIEEYYDDDSYPIDLVIFFSSMNKYYIYSVNPFDDDEDEDEDVSNTYYRFLGIREFYDDTEVLNYIKNKGNLSPDYNPKGRNLRKI